MNIESTPINAVDNSSWHPIDPENEQGYQDDTGLEDEAENDVAAHDPLLDVESDDDLDADLPEPDRDNITVFTKKLPNKPILPWNRYDSPWSEEEEEEQQKQAKAETEASTTEGSDSTDIEEDEVE